VFLVITGLAQESKIAAGPGVSHVVCSGSDPERLRGRLTRLDPTGLRAVISFGIAGGLDPSLHPGDVVVATAVIAETGAWKVPASVVTSVVERVRASGICVVQGALAGVEEPILLPIDKAAVHRETEAIAVDMESHIGAAYAAERPSIRRHPRDQRSGHPGAAVVGGARLEGGRADRFRRGPVRARPRPDGYLHADPCRR